MRWVLWMIAGGLVAPAAALAQATEAEQGAPAEAVAKAAPRQEQRAVLPVRKGPAAEGSGPQVKLEAELAAGYFRGYQVRRDAGLVATAELGADVRWEQGPWKFALPVSIGHRQTMLAWLPQTAGKAELQAEYDLGARTRLQAQAGLGGAWRPGWADLYEPISAGQYSPTSRYSYWTPELGVKWFHSPSKGHHLHAGYSVSRPDYLDDPGYDADLEPMHIAPSDHTRHELDLGWRWNAQPFRLTASADSFVRQDHFLVARDAQTGATHANPGGAAPNPKQLLVGVEPAGEVEWNQGPLELEARYGYEVVVDTFEGYYSFGGHHPQVRAVVSFGPRTRLQAKAEAWVREYGPNSYQGGTATRPALEYGSRRLDRKLELSGGGELGLTDALSLTAELRWVTRDTNFPDYVPLSFPATRQYDIDWDYKNFSALGGIVYRY